MSTAMNKNDEIPVSEFVPADRSKIDMEQIVRPSVSLLSLIQAPCAIA